MIHLVLGDCLEKMRTMPSNSVDSIVTDPPYGLGFMGKKWDVGVPAVDVFAECLRVLKPGGHLLAFGGSRTYHRLAVAVEDGGFEIRDQIMWVYGSGFPKSQNVSKAIDKAAGAEREVLGVVDPRGTFDGRERKSQAINTNWRDAEGRNDVRDLSKKTITTPATDAARQWDGWGTALKPAHEPIVVARKPLTGTVAANVLAHGTGALNIDGCRVGTEEELGRNNNTNPYGSARTWNVSKTPPQNNVGTAPQGRWPANLIHDGSDEVVACFPQTVTKSSGGSGAKSMGALGKNGKYGTFALNIKAANAGGLGDEGTPARFFYCAKASKKDRGEGNKHPTVKPTNLMRYLVRLVTPPGGTVLDPFMGSGSTGKAAVLEGFDFIGIELDEDSVEVASRRIHEAEATTCPA